MKGFWSGFEKRAVSLTGMKSGLRSGKRNFSSFGKITSSSPKSGIVEAPRSVPPPLPTPVPISTEHNLAPRPEVRLPKTNVPKPPKKSGRGVSSTNI